jgi:hypothetical protein
MKRSVFCLAFYILLFAATNFGQTRTSEISADLCREKKAGLEKFEAEAVDIRRQITTKEKELNLFTNPSNDDIRYQFAEAERKFFRGVEIWREGVKDKEAYDRMFNPIREEYSYWKEIKELNDEKNTVGTQITKPDGSKMSYGEKRKTELGKELSQLRERQTFVANQIYLLRDQIPPAGCAENKLAGDWTGTSGSGGLREEWYIRNDNGQWTVTGKWFRGSIEAGSFSGTDYKFENGHLTFTQTLDKAPIEGWKSGTKLEVWAEGDTMTFRWTTANGANGTVTQRRKSN